jgi:hypothetical protein
VYDLLIPEKIYQNTEKTNKLKVYCVYENRTSNKFWVYCLYDLVYCLHDYLFEKHDIVSTYLMTQGDIWCTSFKKEVSFIIIRSIN